MSIRSITILGCGALGLYYGSKLAKAGYNVKFLLRSDYNVIKNKGVKIYSIHGDFEIKINCFNDPLKCEVSDLVIIALKTTAKEYLLKTLPLLISSSSYVLTLQNGLKNEELINSVIDASKILGGIAFLCSVRKEPGVILHTAYGNIKANAFSKKCDNTILKEITDLFITSGINFEIADSLPTLKWEKLIWNVPFNGISASLGGVDTQKILNHPPLRKITEELMKEVILGAQANDIFLDNSLIKQNIDKTLNMGPYMTSMAIDRIKNNPIEVESIIGEPLRAANKKGIKLPYMEHLYAELSFYNENIIKK